MARKKETISILDEGCAFEGTIAFTGRLVIRGTLKGEIKGESVVISREGSALAEIKAGDVTIGGTFEGRLRAMRALTILSTGSCRGKVVCKDIVVEPGGVLNAEVTRLTAQPESEY